MITNMQSPCTGNPVANQFVINADGGQYFQSYNMLVAFKPANGDTPTVTDAWDCSATTLKYLKVFLGTSQSKAQLQKLIDAGSLILDNNLTIKG